MKPIFAAIPLLILLGIPASADPWKDESGHSRWRGGYERHDERTDRWKYPDRPAGHQPPPYRC
jgi:hypothetical protein